MPEASNTALMTFAIYTLAVFLLAVLANRASKGKEFVGEYFLGSRSFGVWALALTFAATNASGGSFMGFPALIYTHGWTLALWIAGYIIVPLVSMGLMGKRLNEVARKCDALTIPEVLKGRFESSRVGLVATSLLIFFMFFYLVAQFKAGGKILSTLLANESYFQSAVELVSSATQNIPWVNQAEPDYLVCLLVFSVAVIVYVVYGGFRAVVWTDVMQGIVMFVGVILMLGLALWQVGGLTNATRQLAEMTPPENGIGTVTLSSPATTERSVEKGTWIAQTDGVYRLAAEVTIPAGQVESEPVDILKITTAEEINRLRREIESSDLRLKIEELTRYKYGAGQKGVYVTNPGPSPTNQLGFLAIGSAISFFIFWPFGAAGQPSNMVRLLSFKDTRTLRYSIVTVGIYYGVIYLALVIIFCCARVLMPGMEIDPDRTMPDFATKLTVDAGVPWLAGVLVAAPFAAVMSSVDSFLLVVSSAVVRDVYQGEINQHASEKRLRLLSHLVTVVVGLLAILFVLNPPTYLQDLIVFATGGLAACFLVPMVLSLYWKRMTGPAAIAGMLGGTMTHLGLTCWGYLKYQEFRAYEFVGLNPFIWDLAGSIIACLVVVWIGPKASRRLVERFF
ncbi:MAG: sodium:solute symporter family transporter [Rubripirellula sp.]